MPQRKGKAVLAATTHTDFFENLKPSVHVHKRFGKEIEVSHHQNEPAKDCSLKWHCSLCYFTHEDIRAVIDYENSEHGGKKTNK